MSKTFPQESCEAFFELRKSALRRTKKLHQHVLTELRSTSKKRHRFIWLLKKKRFGTLPSLLNKPMGFTTKLLEKQFKDSP